MYTKLKAVNLMLSTVGESPVEALDAGFEEAELAKRILEEVIEEVQAHDWHFNRETDLELLPDSNGFVFLPANTLRVDDVKAESKIIQRGSRLYDKKTHTYVISKSVKVDIQVKLAFEELPYPAQHYIAIRAARLLQQRSLNSNNLDNFIAEEEDRAFKLLRQYDTDEADYNMFDSPEMAFIVGRQR